MSPGAKNRTPPAPSPPCNEATDDPRRALTPEPAPEGDEEGARVLERRERAPPLPASALPPGEAGPPLAEATRAGDPVRTIDGGGGCGMAVRPPVGLGAEGPGKTEASEGFERPEGPGRPGAVLGRKDSSGSEPAERVTPPSSGCGAGPMNAAGPMPNLAPTLLCGVMRSGDPGPCPGPSFVSSWGWVLMDTSSPIPGPSPEPAMPPAPCTPAVAAVAPGPEPAALPGPGWGDLKVPARAKLATVAAPPAAARGETEAAW